MEAHRRYDLDWLRVMAVLLLIPFHTAMIYNQWDWHIKYQPASQGLTVFNGFLGIWHMPLFFILSGAATGIALKYKPNGDYIKERVKRLLVPLVFGILVIVPPQIYCERLFRGQFSGSFIQFYPSIFSSGTYPQGNLSWHHLWFIAYLFMFSLLTVPLFSWLNSSSMQPKMKRFTDWISYRNRILLLALPLFIIQVLLRVKYPGDQNLINDWANFLFYITVFIYGFLLISSNTLWKAMTLLRWKALAIGCSISLVNLIMEITGHGLPWSYNLPMMLLLGIRGLETWCWIIAILGLGNTFLNHSHRLLPYAARAAFPFYIIHQTVIVVLGFFIIRTGWLVATQYILINILAFIITLVLYDLLVKRVGFIGFLFGIKLEPYRRVLATAELLPSEKKQKDRPMLPKIL